MTPGGAFAGMAETDLIAGKPPSAESLSPVRPRQDSGLPHQARGGARGLRRRLPQGIGAGTIVTPSSLDELEQIATKTAAVRLRITRLVDSTVDAAAQLLDESSEQERVDAADGEVPIEQDCGLPHEAGAFGCAKARMQSRKISCNRRVAIPSFGVRHLYRCYYAARRWLLVSPRPLTGDLELVAMAGDAQDARGAQASRALLRGDC